MSLELPKTCLSAVPRVVARAFHSAHHFGRCDAKGLRQSDDCSKCRALYATFNCAQLCPIDAEFDICIQLRKSCRVPNLAYHNPKGLFRT
jgi:hypothetical protein